MGVNPYKKPFWILPVIVFSQFAGTSLWFAGNAILADLQEFLNLDAEVLGIMTSSVQLGFIFGTLCFAWFAISDRLSPGFLFLLSSLAGSFSNLCIYLFSKELTTLLVFRFITGFFLAGIYPVGMKIAADWYRKDLGKAIGFLVAALVVGTAFPHLVKSFGGSLDWRIVLISVSILSAFGGLMMFIMVPQGPYINKGSSFDPKVLFRMFKLKEFRSAVFGYFGHMWELYTFWAFVPVILIAYISKHGDINYNISFLSFIIIAAGAVGCAVGGIISLRAGSAVVAFVQLLMSGMCCILSPLMYNSGPLLFIGFLILWGITVVGDSPQFSALTAKTAPVEYIGTALTLANCIGFSITIISIQFVNYLSNHIDIKYLLLLLIPGPIFGLISLYPIIKSVKLL